jgi:hypothetical protein
LAGRERCRSVIENSFALGGVCLRGLTRGVGSVLPLVSMRLGDGFEEVERARVAQHILRAEAFALRRKVRLRPLQRLARQLLLRELAVYRKRGRFPKNHGLVEPTPSFVDAEGSRCAVAHLLEASGEGALVQRIAHRRNHARVADLVDEARLVAWLDVAGLSLEEAALIQPSYCFHRGGCVCNVRRSGYFEAVTTTKVVDGICSAQVNAIRGKPSQTSVLVGNIVRVRGLSDQEVGTEIVVSGTVERYTDGNIIFSATAFPLRCAEGTPALSKEQYLQAVLADDCEATLDTFGDWTPPCSDGCGCRAVGRIGAPTTLGIVLSLLGLAVARRMQRVSP